KAAGLTAIVLLVALKLPALVVNFRSTVSALRYERPLNVATPENNVTVVGPWTLEEPTSPVTTVTVCVLSFVTTLPKASSAVTTGCCAKLTPAVAVEEGWVVIDNWLIDAGLTVTLLLVAVKLPALVEKLRLSVSALVYERFVNVATPEASVTVVVPCTPDVPRLPV